jgi:hypothetical protein
MTKITFPLQSGNSVSVIESTNGSKSYICAVIPSKQYPLDRIPKGGNPRDVDTKTKIAKAIQKSYEYDTNFALKNRGIKAIIDDKSLTLTETEKGQTLVSFSCSSTDDFTGHYDGQHTLHMVMKAINANPNIIKKVVKIELVERSSFNSMQEVREVANATNAIQKQQTKSEVNSDGCFDTLKKNLTYCDRRNVGFQQNQVSMHGEKVKIECGMGQVTSLLGPFLPLTYHMDYSLSEIVKWPLYGEERIMKLWKNDEVSDYLIAASEKINEVLELSDHVQSNMAIILRGKHDDYGILKSHSTTKSLKDRRPHKSHLFLTAKPIQFTLNKAVMPVVLHGFIENFFKFDKRTSKFISKLTVEEMKAVWQCCGEDVLVAMEQNYTNNFGKTNYKRYADYAALPNMWAEVSAIVRDSYYRNTWKAHIPSFAAAK